MPEATPEPPAANGAWYSYAVIRVVPRVDREEFVNVGIVLFARTLRFLEARINLREERLKALSPDVDIDLVRRHLDAFQAVAEGRPEGGPIASQGLSERFHWLTAPRSTMIQTSAVHVGICEDPRKALDNLMRELVD